MEKARLRDAPDMIMLSVVLPILLLGVGLALLVVEDLLPMGGAFLMLAAACLVGLIVQGFLTSTQQGYRVLIVEAVLVPGVYFTSMFVVPRTPFGRRGFLRPPEAEDLEVSHSRPDLSRLIGVRGRAMTPLRPSGMVEIDGDRLDAVADRGLIEARSAVEVVATRSGRLVVRGVPDPP